MRPIQAFQTYDVTHGAVIVPVDRLDVLWRVANTRFSETGDEWNGHKSERFTLGYVLLLL
uniref:Uncharacterized protein n=1 Tax=Candidatus Kentrum sp. SD TaxID=2126332 RepID=A0A450YAV1_9GAMM|nr:MAG: hypothetical protein BECKSD772F_GA0070984_100168 [Candidatus Kentron sp. SD]VFK38657.1 MAG: hypothetical protein BECKSD772E_GA0070983_100167 [Candidatus Kentron sp. SD]